MKSGEVRIVINNIPGIRKSLGGDVLMEAVKAGGMVIKANAMINASRGKPGLSIDSGDLTNSIMVEEAEKTATSARVNIGPTVIYAAIHEFGGIISAKAAKALHFVIDGKHIVKQTVYIPARPYLRPAVDEHLEEIRQAVAHQIQKAIERAVK